LHARSVEHASRNVEPEQKPTEEIESRDRERKPTMPGEFIDVKVDAAIAADPQIARKLEEVCPVSIFVAEPGGGVRIDDSNLDECVLCDLCLEAAPKGKIEIVKLYE
jgi:NAD-dependent dihydropyrimidine dehydrogenase PreA subunit